MTADIVVVFILVLVSAQAGWFVGRQFLKRDKPPDDTHHGAVSTKTLVRTLPGERPKDDFNRSPNVTTETLLSELVSLLRRVAITTTPGADVPVNGKVPTAPGRSSDTPSSVDVSWSSPVQRPDARVRMILTKSQGQSNASRDAGYLGGWWDDQRRFVVTSAAVIAELHRETILELMARLGARDAFARELSRSLRRDDRLLLKLTCDFGAHGVYAPNIQYGTESMEWSIDAIPRMSASKAQVVIDDLPVPMAAVVTVRSQA